MKPIDHILVPTDFSMHSKAALEEACGLAQRLGASIDLLYVWPGSHPVACEIFDHVTDDHGGELARFAQTLEGRELEALLRITRDYGVCVRGRLEAGDAARAILAVAERDGHDLIVMGTHGRTGLVHLVLGSVAETVVRHAVCPVMTVRAAKARAARAAAGASGHAGG